MTTRPQSQRRVRASAVLSEAWRNLATGTSRPLLVAALAVVALGGIAATDVLTIVGLSRQAEEFRTSGAAVQLFSAPDGISGQRCDALGSLPGVLGAGATRQADTPAVFLTSPRSGIPTVEATVGIGDVLGVEGGALPGLWLSSTVAETLGADVGTVLPTSAGPVTVTAHYRYPPDASDRSLAHAAVATVPSAGLFDACWVLVWPSSRAVDSLIRTTYAGDPAEQSTATMGQLNTRLGAAFDGPTLYRNRATSGVLGAAVVFGFALGVGCVSARRLELSSAMHSGYSRSAIVAQVSVELIAVVLAVGVITLPFTYYVAADGNPDPVWPAWSAGLRVVAAGLLSTVVGGSLMAATTSEKRLFRYFKDR